MYRRDDIEGMRDNDHDENPCVAISCITFPIPTTTKTTEGDMTKISNVGTKLVSKIKLRNEFTG